VRETLLVVWLALLGASRVDFLAGAGPFLLTPFLVLTPVVIGAELWRAAASGWSVRLPPGGGSFLVAMSALMGLVLLSTMFAWDLPSATRRFALLFVQVYGVIVVAVAIANRPDPGGILLRGAYAGLGLSLAMNGGQLIYWLRSSLWPDPLARVLDLAPGTYFGVIPRFTGVSHDPNLGGFLLLFYLGLVLLLAPPSRRRTVWVVAGAVALVLTLSRSAVLAAGVFSGFLIMRRLEIRIAPAAVGGAGVLVALLTLAYLFVPGAGDGMVRLAEMLSHRFTVDEGSAREHTLLLVRGWEVGTETVKQVLLGIGYGNAHVVVQDIFPGNEYGNFHSLFLTFFAEAGAPAAVVLLGIFGAAFIRGGEYRPLIAAMIVFNLFQQAHTDPALWLGLMLAWTGTGLLWPDRGPGSREAEGRTAPAWAAGAEGGP
jgi:hypothetical protein